MSFSFLALAPSLSRSLAFSRALTLHYARSDIAGGDVGSFEASGWSTWSKSIDSSPIKLKVLSHNLKLYLTPLACKRLPKASRINGKVRCFPTNPSPPDYKVGFLFAGSLIRDRPLYVRVHTYRLEPTTSLQPYQTRRAEQI